MKKQNSSIKAQIIRSAFILLSLFALCAIPFALAQRAAIKKTMANPMLAKPTLAQQNARAQFPITARDAFTQGVVKPTLTQQSAAANARATFPVAPGFLAPGKQPAVHARSFSAPSGTTTLWYNGDFNQVNGLYNGNDTGIGAGNFASVYDDFNVTDSGGWNVTAVFSDNLENTNVTGATWEIRQGVSSGNGGTLIASGMTMSPVVTPTGRSGFGFTEYQIEVTGLSVPLPFSANPYWLNVTPIGDGTGASYDSNTSGANCVGTPCGNNINSFWNSNFFGANFETSSAAGDAADFSMGVIGTVTQACPGLVVNGGFETGSLPPWTDTGDTSFTGVSTGIAHSGTYALFAGPGTSDGFIDQTIPTVAGQGYDVTFWLENLDGTNDNRFGASFGSVTLVPEAVQSAFGYTQYTFTNVIPGANADLHFIFFNPPAYFYLDDVCVTASAGATPTPTPTPACIDVNGGFETGSFPPWTISGDTSFTSVNGDNVHSGNFSEETGPGSSDGFTDQVLPTVAGQAYDVTFWLANLDGSNSNRFGASFGSVTLVPEAVQSAFGYTQYTFTNVVPGANADLHFIFFNPPSYFYLDDVCVTASAGATPTPTASPTCSAVGAYRVLVLSADCSNPESTLIASLQAEPGIATVTLFDGTIGTPTLAQLQQSQDIVLAFSDCTWQDPTTLGNNLDAYLTGGGVVVAANFDWYATGSQSIGGAWITLDSPFNDNATGNFTTGTLQTCTSAPLCNGVTTLQSFLREIPTLAAGATAAGTWNDGSTMMAYKGRTVAISGYFGDEDDNYSGQFPRIVANAGRYYLPPCASPTPTPTASPIATATATATATPTVAATATATPTASPSCTPSFRVLIAYSDVGGQPTVIQSAILAEPGVTACDLFDASSGTPTLSQLQRSNVVFAFSDNAWFDATGMGNVLADYEDAGGIVEGTAPLPSTTGAGGCCGGRWVTGGYTPYNSTGTTNFTSNTATIASNCLTQGVNTLTATYRNGVTLTSGAVAVATWTDGPAGGSVSGQQRAYGSGDQCVSWVDLNQFSGDWGHLIVNAGRCFGAPPCGTPTPTPTAASPTATATATATVTGTPSATPTCVPVCTPGTWTQAAPVAIDHYGGFMDSNGTFAYEGGGYSFSAGGTINQFGRFDPVANTWTPLAPVPDLNNAEASGVYAPNVNKLFVFGGDNPTTGVVVNTTRIYDIASNTWSTGANMPDVRAFMASGYNSGNGKIYLVGGYSTGNITPAFLQTWEYDPVRKQLRDEDPHTCGDRVRRCGFGCGERSPVCGGRTRCQ